MARRSKPHLRAASHAAGGRSIDGWRYWRTTAGRTLDDLRQDLLDRVALESRTGATDTEGEAGQLTPAGLQWLKTARDDAISGNPRSITLRDLLSYWGLKRRDGVEFEHVRQSLAERGLRAEPDVASAALDDVVRLNRAATTPPGRTPPGPPKPPGNDPVTPGPDPSDFAMTSGLTVRSLWKSDRPLAAVQVNEDLQIALTKMQMHGYSQLPVLSGKGYRGAVTWETIGRALRANPDASLADATFVPETCHLDRQVLEVMPSITAHGFIVVFDQGPPCGVVTLADVAEAFVQMATPFALVGDIDRRLRAALDQAVDWDYLLQIVDPDGQRKLDSIDRLTFGDYLSALRSKDLWAQMGWWVNQKVFVEGIDAVRVLRNKITHFNPDPPTDHEMEQLRGMNRLVVELTSSVA